MRRFTTARRLPYKGCRDRAGAPRRGRICPYGQAVLGAFADRLSKVGTKRHVLADCQGIPLALDLAPPGLDPESRITGHNIAKRCFEPVPQLRNHEVLSRGFHEAS